jgi:phosphoglucosamine mutase
VSIRFGTDGVRGPAGTWPIDEAGARTIGQAMAAYCQSKDIFVGRDTRESGPSLAAAVIEGLIAGGSTALDLGVVPTAAVSCAAALSPHSGGGIMVTASHNIWSDNGLKVVGGNGEKLHDTAGLAAFFDDVPPAEPGRVVVVPRPLLPWHSRLPDVDLSGLKILFDGAHGAAHACGPSVLEALGATVVRRGCSPSGTNINDSVGALHPPEDLQGCDLAICLDGDADRLVMVHPDRGVLNGDDLLWMLAGQGSGPVVGTVMTNGGLEAALGDRLIRVAVGDANVAAGMAQSGAKVGGEPSGHTMYEDGMPTSDGMATALEIFKRAQGGPLPVEGWTRWPQAHRNVRDAVLPEALPPAVAAELEGHRVLVRASGTEPVIRVMVEGADAERWADRIADALNS